MATLNVENWHIPRLKGDFVSYLRDSELRYTKLNIAAQRNAVAALLSESSTQLIDTFVEQEPLVNGTRPALEEAIAVCKSPNRKLLSNTSML